MTSEHKPLAAKAKRRPPRPACRVPLDSVGACRRELAAVYRAARSGTLDWKSAARAASILFLIARLIGATEHEQRIAEIEEQLLDRLPPPNGNGHAGYS